MNRAIVGLVVVGALLFACGKKDSAGGAAASSSAGAAASVTGVGIKECDEYIAKIQACFAKDSKLKEEAEAGFKAQTDAWKERAVSDKDGTQALCKTAVATIGIAYPSCK